MAKVVIALDQEDYEDLLELLDEDLEIELYEAVHDAPRMVIP